MNIKNITLAILLSTVLIFAGCTTDADGKQSVSIPGIGGGDSTSKSSTSGVEIKFEQLNFKPQKGNEFSMVMNILNHQKQPIDVTVRPSGFDWNYVESGLQKEFTLSLSPATNNGPNQNAHYIEGIKLNGFTGNYNWNPTFKYCYQAKSEFREQICIPNNLNSCDADISASTYSAGPLKTKVNSIYPIGQDKIGVEFTVTNSNDGVVVNECFQDENKNQFGNKVTDPVVKLGTQQGSCSATSTSNGFVVNQNKLQFKCEFDRSGEASESYASQISLEFSYNYAQQVKNQITVVDLENQFN